MTHAWRARLGDDIPRLNRHDLGYTRDPVTTGDGLHEMSHVVLAHISTLMEQILPSRTQILNSLHLILKPLPLIRAATHTNIALNPHNAIGVEQAMALAYKGHTFHPGAFCWVAKVRS